MSSEVTAMGNQAIKYEGPDDVAWLEAQIQGRLRDYVRDFRMVVRDGGLFLYGRARTYYAKQLVQHGVMGLCRLPIRANEIQVI